MDGLPDRPATATSCRKVSGYAIGLAAALVVGRVLAADFGRGSDNGDDCGCGEVIMLAYYWIFGNLGPENIIDGMKHRRDQQ